MVLFCRSLYFSWEEDVIFIRDNGSEWYVGSIRNFIEMVQVQKREKCVVWSSQDGFLEEVRFDLFLKIVEQRRYFVWDSKSSSEQEEKCLLFIWGLLKNFGGFLLLQRQDVQGWRVVSFDQVLGFGGY